MKKPTPSYAAAAVSAIFLAVLFLTLVFMPESARAQEPTASDVAQDVAAADANAAAIEAATAKATVLATAAAVDRANIVNNEQRLQAAERMTATQNFTLQILMIVMPLLTLMATAAVAYMQMRARGRSEILAVEQRSNLAAMATSINGVKSELVAATQARAFFEARTLELERQLNPAIAAKVEARSVEVSEEARQASAAATVTADAVSIQLAGKAGAPCVDAGTPPAPLG